MLPGHFTDGKTEVKRPERFGLRLGSWDRTGLESEPARAVTSLPSHIRVNCMYTRVMCTDRNAESML